MNPILGQLFTAQFITCSDFLFLLFIIQAGVESKVELKIQSALTTLGNNSLLLLMSGELLNLS